MQVDSHVEHVHQSMLGWMFQSLGPFYGLLIPLAAFGVFVGACLVVALSRRPAVIAAYLPLLLLPLMIGVFGTLQGFTSSLQVIAVAQSAPKPSEVAEGVSMGLFTSLLALLLSFPAYFVTTFGLLMRTLLYRDATSSEPQGLKPPVK
jgi:hypothetical protein